MKRLLSLLFPVILFMWSASAQEIIYPVTNFTTKEYGREYHPQNWAVAQDKRGLIYFANGFRLLEYDGHSWRSYPLNRETMILSIATGESGCIYAGSQNEFGSFQPDPVSGFRYVSFSDSLNPEERFFSNIRCINTFDGAVAFLSEEKLFILKNGEISSIAPETTFHTSFSVNGKLYIRQRDIGLVEYINGKLSLVKGGEKFASTGIFFMVPYGSNQNEILIGTREIGLWILKTQGSSQEIRPFQAKAYKILENAQITAAVQLPENEIAISTLNSGVIIMNSDGDIKSVINKRTGLSDNDVKNLIRDRENNLWLSLENGISYVQCSSPVSVYDSKSGIEGSVNAVCRHNGLIYAGTTAGLFVNSENSFEGLLFTQVSGIKSPVRALAVAGGRLFIGTDDGIYELKGTLISRISENRSGALLYSSYLKMLISGGDRITAFRLSDKGLKKEEVPGTDSDIISISEKNVNDKEGTEIWAGTRYDGVFRITGENGNKLKTDHYTADDGLAPGPILVFSYEKSLILGTIDGLFAFTDENKVRENLPDSLKDNPDFARGFFSPVTILGDTITGSVSALAFKSDRIWICSENQMGLIEGNNLNHTPFLGIDAGKINYIYPEDNGLTWFGTSDGLIRFDINRKKLYDSPFPALSRKVISIRNDSILFNGVFCTGTPGAPELSIFQPENLRPSLPYSSNSLRFEFSAAYYENSEKLLFSTRLDGYDETWKDWSQNYYQDYTNLREGEYSFRVRAMNVFGTVSEESVFSFTILPPWYRTGYAYLAYIILGLGVVWLIIRLYTIRLKRENLRLEGIVRERTAEVVMQRDILEHQKNEIEDSIRYASRIQNAVLPAPQDFSEIIPESFVFFRPRDIVSGDFYWISRVEEKLIVSAADCTGHGVPGAFMSMLGVAFLDEIVNKDHITSPEKILNRLRKKVISALQQQGVSGEAKDGMDIVVICIDETNRRLLYSGAYNPLIMIRNRQLTEYRGDRMPIAIFDNMKEFSLHEISIEKGDRFYFSSDGYEDQFGGPEGKKFKSKQFKELLLKISDKTMIEQKEIIVSVFEQWQGSMSQVDDIVVIGLKI